MIRKRGRERKMTASLGLLIKKYLQIYIINGNKNKIKYLIVNPFTSA